MPIEPIEMTPGSNRNNPVLEVRHADLERADPTSVYRSKCPACPEGTLWLRRDPISFKLMAEDYCGFCGQQVVYLDLETLAQYEGLV